MKKLKVKIHKKPKTQRIYEPVSNVYDTLDRIKSHGDKTLFSYFTTDHKLSDITFAEFYDMTLSLAAGLDALGLSGRRIAVIGETSPEWLCTYLAVMASGGVIVPMDRELATEEVSIFLNG